MVHLYATPTYEKEHMARAVAVNLPISTKHSVEVCRSLRGKTLARAKAFLNQVIKMKEAVPMRRYHHELAHKTGVGPGRYPVKVSLEILRLLESAESNAQFKGLNTAHLVVDHICAHKAGKQWHYGRHRGREMKRTIVEIIVTEQAQEAKQSKNPKESKQKKAK